MTDPLETLLVDEGSIARDELATALEPFIRFARDGTLWPLDAFDQLTSKRKVLCLLLAVKAQHLLGLREDELVSPGQLVEMSEMAPGTVRPKLSELVRERRVAKAGHSYVMSGPGARRALAELAESRL